MKSKLKNIVIEELHNVLKELDTIEKEYPYSRTSMESKTDAYLFTVKNDIDGLKKIRTVKDALSDIYRFKVRGRHHDRKEVLGSKYKKFTQNDIPLQQAEYLAVYVYPKK